jgi:chromate reductase, NAD(P)H dehydrogenase (quinone)
MTTFLGIAGSLRAASMNRGLIRAAAEVAPDSIEVRQFDIASLPFYNADIEAAGDPEPVSDLKEAIRSADALLIATPEYNYNIPGVLKNALDWASRPGPQASVLRGKPIGLIGATVGFFGTTRAQLALRQCFIYTESAVMPAPQLLLMSAGPLFDQQGNLTDEPTRERLRGFLGTLAEWARMVSASRVE